MACFYGKRQETESQRLHAINVLVHSLASPWPVKSRKASQSLPGRGWSTPLWEPIKGVRDNAIFAKSSAVLVDKLVYCLNFS